MGSLEELIQVAKALETKMDGLIAALASNGGALPEKTTRAKKTPTETATDKAAAASAITSDQVGAEFDRIKALPNATVPALKKVIADLGYSTLADLRTHPEKFEEAMAALKAYETSLTAADDDL